jgi:hypothetical protein
MTTTDTPAILDCGDPPTHKLGHAYAPNAATRAMLGSGTIDARQCVCECGEPYAAHGIGTGYAQTPDGRTICYAHAETEERAAFAVADAWTAYDSGATITTWTGAVLARVESSWLTGGHAAGRMHHVRAIAPDGSRWWGKYLDGWSECVTLRRVKGPIR